MDGAAGRANCNMWTSASSSHLWTHVRLSRDWTNAATQDVHVWDASMRYCSRTLRVWCVADKDLDRVYVPLILRDPFVKARTRSLSLVVPCVPGRQTCGASGRIQPRQQPHRGGENERPER